MSLLGPKLQPDRLVLHEELFGDGVTVPQPESLAAGFYGKNFLVPKGADAAADPDIRWRFWCTTISIALRRRSGCCVLRRMS